MAECAWQITAGQIEVEVVVPPNTTAGVTLPGSQTPPVVVGSGTYRWSIPYRSRPPARPVFSLDSRIGDIVEDHEAWEAVLATVRRYRPGFNGAQFRRTGYIELTLRQALSRLPNAEAMLADSATALAALER